MGEFFALEPLKLQAKKTVQTLETCNKLTQRFGLSLSLEQIQTLMEHRVLALKNTGRIEFGEGILKRLIYAFCDSPYVSQEDYVSILSGLQDMFYYFKNESMERLSDDELIEAMKTIFDGKAQGSLEYLSGTSLETICRVLRGGAQDDTDHLGSLYVEDDDYE